MSHGPVGRNGNPARVVYRYKQPFRDGSTQVVLEPLDFIARLAALVPRPRLGLTCFHSAGGSERTSDAQRQQYANEAEARVFSASFKCRSRIVPHRSRRSVDDDKLPAPRVGCNASSECSPSTSRPAPNAAANCA
ncbi:MAG: transposase [Xanthomonadales bacterium]|nr:transposase [Xanthomonadales bacterium]